MGTATISRQARRFVRWAYFFYFPILKFGFTFIFCHEVFWDLLKYPATATIKALSVDNAVLGIKYWVFGISFSIFSFSCLRNSMLAETPPAKMMVLAL